MNLISEVEIKPLFSMDYSYFLISLILDSVDLNISGLSNWQFFQNLGLIYLELYESHQVLHLSFKN